MNGAIGGPFKIIEKRIVSSLVRILKLLQCSQGKHFTYIAARNANLRANSFARGALKVAFLHQQGHEGAKKTN